MKAFQNILNIEGVFSLEFGAICNILLNAVITRVSPMPVMPSSVHLNQCARGGSTITLGPNDRRFKGYVDANGFDAFNTHMGLSPFDDLHCEIRHFSL